MLNKKMKKAIGYDDIVKKIASNVRADQIESFEMCLDTEAIKRHLEEYSFCDKLEFSDLYKIVAAVKREKRGEEYERETVESTFNSLPWAAQQAAQEAICVLMKKASEDKLYKMDEAVDVSCEFLFSMFYCCVADIKEVAKKMRGKSNAYTYREAKEGRILFDFIAELRKSMWWDGGDVLTIRTEKTA